MLKTILGNLLNKSPDGELFNDLTDIDKKKRKLIKILRVSSTPIFFVNPDVLLRNYGFLKEICTEKWGNFHIAYSFKTNYEIAKLKLFKQNGLLAEVVSGWEYQMARKLGYRGKNIIFNGPGKTSSDLNMALDQGSLVMVDNFNELERVDKIAKKCKKHYQIGIRVKLETSPFSKSRFGFSIKNGDAQSAVLQIVKSSLLNLVALHMHIGSDVDSVEKYKLSARLTVNFVNDNIDSFENRLKYLDFGGGFPSRGLSPFDRIIWKPQPIKKYVEAIVKEISELALKNKPTIIFEPGRYLVDDAVFFITRVIDSKIENLKQLLTIDATLSEIPLVEYRRQVVKLYDKNLNTKNSNEIQTSIYGRSCRENDFIYRGLLSQAKVGDVLIFFIVGAYNQNMSSDFIFGKTKCISI